MSYIFSRNEFRVAINCHWHFQNKGIHLFFPSVSDIYLRFTNHSTHSIILPSTVVLIHAFNDLYSQPHLDLICMPLWFTIFACLSSWPDSFVFAIGSWLLVIGSSSSSLLPLDDSYLSSLGLPFLALLCPTLSWLALSLSSFFLLGGSGVVLYFPLLRTQHFIKKYDG